MRGELMGGKSREGNWAQGCFIVCALNVCLVGGKDKCVNVYINFVTIYFHHHHRYTISIYI